MTKRCISVKAKPPTIHNRQSTDLPINSLVAFAVVDDPYSVNGERIAVVRSIRDDILAAMLSRDEIDQAQYDAGRLYEKYAEQSEIGNVQAIDPSKEEVDGGGWFEPVSDRQIDAVRALSEAARVLGPKGEGLVRWVLVRRKPFSALGLSVRATSQARVMFFTYLEILAEFWGCKTKGRG